MKPQWRSMLGLWALICAVIISGVAVVYAKNQSRELFLQLQASRAAHAQALIEWNQWQLELATQGNLQQVLQIARSRLNMHIPQHSQHLFIDP
jgi:cell division protein FtsL